MCFFFCVFLFFFFSLAENHSYFHLPGMPSVFMNSSLFRMCYPSVIALTSPQIYLLPLQGIAIRERLTRHKQRRLEILGRLRMCVSPCALICLVQKTECGDLVVNLGEKSCNA
ncbi:hypothetical protein GGR52DRAFT_89648 [Hypoxylon sp. FL1284]|nr:hypothetical protein GGR52DRAFT_89648 [Hypoxylon sp. FL1284]